METWHDALIPTISLSLRPSPLWQVLAYYRHQQPNGTWTAEGLLGRRPGRPRPSHGPWLYLAGLSCADIAAITPLDVAPIAEEYETTLHAMAEARFEPGAALMPLDVCVCLQQRLVLYLQVRHAMETTANMPDARHELALASIRHGFLHRLSPSEVRSVPACVLALLPRHYLLELPPETRLMAYRKIGRLTWHEIMAHLAVQHNKDKFRWLASEMLHDLNVTRNSSLTFEQVAQLNQLLHFVNVSVIERIAPEAFREWIYTLRDGAERLVCGPDPAWAPLVLRAFGEDPAKWNMSTPYYLGGWLFALNDTLRRAVRWDHLRYAVDDHNAALFRKLPDVIGNDSGEAITFLEACRDLRGSTPALRVLFEAARATGTVGYPKPRARRANTAGEVTMSPEEIKSLNLTLNNALEHSNVSETSKELVEELVDSLVSDLQQSSSKEPTEDSEERKLFEFGPSDGSRLRCADLRAAGPAAAAVTAAELGTMSRDVLDLWSCLNTLGGLPWQAVGSSAADIWPVVRTVNQGQLLPENVVHIRGLVAALTLQELSQLRLSAAGEPHSSDAISLLGRQHWRPDQLAVLVNTTLGVTADPETSSVGLYATPAYTSALGNLLCGFSASQLRQLFNNTELYRDTSSAVGRLVNCPTGGALETLAGIAVKTYGPTHSWTEATVASVGAVVAGLRRWQLAALPAEALRGLTPYAARRVATGMLAAGMTPAQLRRVPPPAAKELMAQPGLSTEQQDALLHALHGSRAARAARLPLPSSEDNVATSEDPEHAKDPDISSEREPVVKHWGVLLRKTTVSASAPPPPLPRHHSHWIAMAAVVLAAAAA